MMRAGIFAVALVALSAGSALAGKSVGGYPICQTEDAAKEAVQALAKKDIPWLKSIRQCTAAKDGLKAEVVEVKLNGLVRARIWSPDGKQSFVFWTPIEAVKE